MKIGKLEWNSKGWFWDGQSIHPPYIMLWRVFWLIPYTVVLVLFCVVICITTLDTYQARQVLRDNRPF